MLVAGVGAEASVLTRYLHPSDLVRAKYINKDKEWKQNHRSEVVITGKDERKVNRKVQVVYTC